MRSHLPIFIGLGLVILSGILILFAFGIPTSYSDPYILAEEPELTEEQLAAKTVDDIAFENRIETEELLKELMRQSRIANIEPNTTLFALYETFNISSIQVRSIAQAIREQSNGDPSRLIALRRESRNAQKQSYGVFILIVVLCSAYGIGVYLEKTKRMSSVMHERLWFSALAMSFLFVSLSGFVQMTGISDRVDEATANALHFLHVEWGIIFTIVTYIYIIKHSRHIASMVNALYIEVQNRYKRNKNEAPLVVKHYLDVEETDQETKEV